MSSASSDRLRNLVAPAAFAAAIIAVGLMLRAGQHNSSRVLLIFLSAWVAAPLVTVAFCARTVGRRSESTRMVQLNASFLIVGGSVAVYIVDAFHQLRPQAAFAFAIVPLVSWGILIVLIPLATALARKS